MIKEDLSIRETDDPPIGHWCDSGHVAPEFFRREGKDSDLVKTRFFIVKNRDINKIICEPCLIVANHLAKLKKQGKM